MASLRRVALTVCATVCLVAVGTVAHSAETRALPEQLVARGRVIAVADGDTVRVRFDGGGNQLVRFVGMNANPESFCHGRAAANLMTDLTMGRRTLLWAIDPVHVSMDRLLRTVWIELRNGSYVNPGRVLLQKGLANVVPRDEEWAHNTEFRALADEVMARNRGIWDDDACGSGPQQQAQIDVGVSWNAPGDDQTNLNGEWATVTNLSATTTLNLGGWWLRDASPYRYVFPSGTSVPPLASLRLYSGSGQNSALTHYWRSPVERWMNASSNEKALGDGAYLVDPDGDIREYHLYP